MKCLIEPLGKLGDHDKGYLGCLWCDLADNCVEINQNEGASLLIGDNSPQKYNKFGRLFE